MKQFSFLLVLLWLGVSPCAAGDIPPNWMKPISFDMVSDAAEVLVSVPLDADIYGRSQLNLADLRILDEQGETVSYLRTPISETRTRQSEHRWTVQNPSLSPSDEQLKIEFELKDKAPFPTQLEVVTPLQNFEQRVRVFGVDDNNERLLADDVIFDYTRYMDVRRTQLNLLEHQFRRFRVVIDNPTSEQESQLLQLTQNLQGDAETSREQRFTVERRPFRIERLQLVSTIETHVPDALVLQDWDSQISQTLEDEDKKRTLIEFQTRRQPLSQLSLVTASRNFSRRVSLEHPEEKLGKIDWKPIAHGTVSRFEFGDILEERLTLKFPEARHETYRLVIENRDSAPLTIDGLQAAGPQDQLLFLADPSGSYELHYGSDTQTKPDYDTAAIRHLLSEGIEPVVAELGEEAALSETPGHKAWTFQRLINNRMLLGSLILLVAIVLVISLYQAGKRVSGEKDTPAASESNHVEADS